MFVLDTDHLTLLSYDEGPAGRAIKVRLDRENEGLTTTVVTYEEQVRGWLAFLSNCRSADQLVIGYRRLVEHLEDFREFRVLEFDQAASIIFHELKRSRLRVGAMDLRIAAIVLSREATLLSRNLGDFRKVPGLRAEDWSA